MTIVITMAGLGTRFRKAGYKVPKYQIEAKGHTLFYWSLLSLTGFKTKKYVFIVRKEDDASDFIRRECAQFDIKPQIVEIDYVTSGQAETAMLASELWDDGEPLLIYNIDTYVEAGCMRDAGLKGDGVIPCFPGEGDCWSFVRLNEKGEGVEVREKKRISEHCSVGAYYFASGALYRSLYNEYYVGGRGLEAGERYIAPMYNGLIARGGKVYVDEIPAGCVHVLGTPEDVERFINS